MSLCYVKSPGDWALYLRLYGWIRRLIVLHSGLLRTVPHGSAPRYKADWIFDMLGAHHAADYIQYRDLHKWNTQIVNLCQEESNENIDV